MPNQPIQIPKQMLDAIMAERTRIERDQQAAMQARAAQVQQLQQMMQGANAGTMPQEVQFSPEQLRYGAYRYQSEVAPKQKEYYSKLAQLNNVLTIDPKMESWVSNNIKSLDKQYAGQIKPFEETPQFKSAEAIVNDSDFKKRSVFVDLLGKTIKSVESAPLEKQAGLAKTFLTSLVNSAKGTSDAEQGNEFVRRSLELLNLPEYAQQTGKNLLNPTTIASFLLTKEGQSFSEKLQSNPQAYLEKAKTIHDDDAESWNKQAYERVVLPTSPEYAEKFGILPKQTFREQQQQQPKEPGFGEVLLYQSPQQGTLVSGGGQTITPITQPVAPGTQTTAPAPTVTPKGDTRYKFVTR